MKDELISRKQALENVCYFCESKCDAERHKETGGYGIRCGRWYSLNSMEATINSIPISEDNRPLTSNEIDNEEVVWMYKNGVCIGARLVLHKNYSPDGKTELTNESGARQYAAALLRGGYQFYRRKVGEYNG